jgi:hypothetical protein
MSGFFQLAWQDQLINLDRVTRIVDCSTKEESKIRFEIEGQAPVYDCCAFDTIARIPRRMTMPHVPAAPGWFRLGFNPRREEFSWRSPIVAWAIDHDNNSVIPVSMSCQDAAITDDDDAVFLAPDGRVYDYSFEFHSEWDSEAEALKTAVERHKARAKAKLALV